MISPRSVSFCFCVFAGLFSGTNYVFSSWGPQMSLRCGLTAKAINMVGVSGNLGVYLISPVSGKLVDRTGQRLALVLSSLALFSGYYGLHWEYTQAEARRVFPGLLCLYSFLTGVGSSLANSAALNACAKSFPKNRGSSTAFPIAAYGLSAFLFSRLSYMFFAGKTDEFLLLLAWSCGAALLLSSCFIGVYTGNTVYTSSGMISKDSEESLTSEHSGLLQNVDSYRSRSQESLEGWSMTEITGLDLIHNRDFLLMILTIALLSGNGLMYINNLGNNLTALYRFERLDDVFVPKALEQLQALNVSALSLLNCLGRIFAGLVSDQLQAKFKLQRSAFMVFSGVLFMVGLSLVASNTESSKVVGQTCIIGFAYGCLFGIAPVLCSELFGLSNFSTNWGMMSVFPGISGNVYNLVYGHIYDSHSDSTTHECAGGLRCYQEAFSLSMITTVVAIASAVGLFLHHTRQARTTNAHTN